MIDLDDIFHARARLGAMTLAVSRGKVDFSTLKQELGLTDGNLGAHLKVLEEARYIEVDKSFVGRKPKTTIRPTAKGKKVFKAYLDELERVIRLARS